MKSFVTGLLFVLTVSALAFAQRGSQQQKPAQVAAGNPSDEQTISVNVDLVNILFTVADKKGKFVTNLKKEDFKVFEDEKNQAVTNFSSETDLPDHCADHRYQRQHSRQAAF